MCGRFTLTNPTEAVRDLFGYSPPSEDDEHVLERAWRRRYNIFPTQDVLIARILAGFEGLGVDPLRWGLVPSWAKDLRQGARMINARSETVAEKPAFRSSFKKRRCLVPADGFYEWKKVGKDKQPYYIRMLGHEPFAMAGLWATWASPAGENVASFAILTSEANEIVAEIHHRMPVILPKQAFESWLDPANTDTDKLLEMLASSLDCKLELFPVDERVGKAGNDDITCIQPLRQGELEL